MDRVIEEYRRHKLLSALHEGKYKGRAWKDNDLLAEIEGEGIDEVLVQLRDFVDSRFSQIEDRGGGSPEVAEYVHAIKVLLPRLSDGHLAMLKAHYDAPDQSITATQLADAAGYANYSAANLQYGNVGKALYEEVPVVLPKRKDGSPIYTFALAMAGDRSGDEEHWVWKLRSEVASAIKILGLNV